MIELIKQIPVANELGEGVIWDHHRQRVWWTDIVNSKLYRYDPANDELEEFTTPERLACFAPVQGQEHLIAAFASGFAFYNPDNGKLDWIRKIEEDNPGTRLNDGRTDRQGRFWAGTMVEDRDQASNRGSLYCLDADLQVTKTIEELLITNSLCWSPDGQIMYHCDTPTQKIDSYLFDPESAAISEHMIFTTAEKGCYPDGSIIDAEGYLWNAQWGGSKVVRYAPDGSVDLELAMPVSQPSCVAFAGVNLDLLVVTTAHQDLSAEAREHEPGAGDLFIYQTDFAGLIESPFKSAT
ncbi:MAG: SMP-30/gluconolactonase/LRE family protein [Pseudomonadota bacterium]